METFRSIADPNEKHSLTEYASFYFALSAYQDGQVYVARDIFRQIISKFYTWRKIDEVNLWLTQINFELENYSEALHYFDKIMSGKIAQNGRELKRHHLFEIDSIEVLESLHNEYPEDNIIAEALVKSIEKQPLADKDIGLMESLVNQFKLDGSKYNVPDYSQNVKKDEYTIVVMLPFMFNSYENTRQILRNNLVTALYEGMLLAEEELSNTGKKVRLIPYDTRRNEDVTLEIINKKELKSVDLIVGPLYPDPSKVASQFSFDHHINMINPLSSNSEVIGNNPFSFLFEPSTETQALKAAEYAKKNYTNKTAVILYEDNSRDSLFANLYKAEIEKDSFQVVWFKKFTEEELRRKEDPQDPDEWFEELLVIPQGSIGHILTASSKVVFAANSMSVVNIRGDSIPLMGREEWLNYASIGFDQLEQLDVSFVAPNFYDETSSSYKILRRKILDNYKTTPNQYHVIGYELIRYLGQVLHAHGKYFQTGIRNGRMINGAILQGTQFGTSNNNQLVPIIKFQNAQLQRVDNAINPGNRNNEQDH